MSSILKNMRETAGGLHKIGLLDDITMKEIDALCIGKPKQYSAKEIKRIRKKAHLSQSVLAKIFNISPSTVKQWEQGVKNPSGCALRMLEVVDKHGIEAVI